MILNFLLPSFKTVSLTQRLDCYNIFFSNPLTCKALLVFREVTRSEIVKERKDLKEKKAKYIKMIGFGGLRLLCEVWFCINSVNMEVNLSTSTALSGVPFDCTISTTRPV